ncbi:hypothetical protein O0L34_g4658 [Tuta absoluta]|nr:hypothetical protein O0L34_g4658 [Tuta absoluta]
MSLSKPKRATWTEDNLAAAIRAIRNGCSTYKASSEYGIPRRTLRNHVSSGSVVKRLGRHTVLTPEEENNFVERIIKFSDLGIPMTPKMIRIQAFAFCEKYNIAHNFNSNTGYAGKGWLRLFLKRHPELARRKAQMLNPARAQRLNKPIVTPHFNEIRKLYDELDLHDHPEKVYNMDEKGCRLTLHRQPTVIAQKGAKRVHLQASEHGENVTVVRCANAVGNAIPPLILFKGKRKKPEYDLNLPAGSAVLMAPKGTMTTNLFIAFIQHFAKFKPFGKCLLIFDGAKCHLDFRIAEEAERHDIVLYCLPSNTTHELQPLDKACYKPFETYWDQEVLTGFRATGLYPLNPNIIPETAFAPSLLTHRSSEPSRTNDSSPNPTIECSPPRELEFAEHAVEKSTDTLPDTDNSGQSSPITTLRELENLISEADHLPTSPATPDLKFLRDFSSMASKTPPQVDIVDTEYDYERPGPSGLQIQKRLVDYSDSDRSSGAEIMSDFIHRPKPPNRFRIYSSTDSETDMENVEPNIMSQKEIQICVSSGEDDIPLAEINSKTRFKTFLPTPDYGVVKTCTRKKAINYKDCDKN